MEVLNPKVSYTGIFDLIGVGVVKQFEERLTSPFIGNGTLMSGGIKLIAGGLAHSTLSKNRIGNIIGSAILVDAGEDLAIGLMGMLGGGLGGGNQGSNDGFSA